MGDYNPNASAKLGLEALPKSSREITLNSPLQAVALRVAPGAVTPQSVDALFTEVAGNPRLCIEVVSSLEPTVTVAQYVPASDESMSATYWVDNAGGAATFADVDEFGNTAEYVKNVLQHAATTAEITFLNRGSGSLTGKKILEVAVQVAAQVAYNKSGNKNVYVKPYLSIGGTTYVDPTTLSLPNSSTSPVVVSPASWGRYPLSPATGVPWTAATLNFLLAATAGYGFGVSCGGQFVVGGLRIIGTRLQVTYCNDIRFGFYHSASAPYVGWNEYALTSGAALSANTHYWIVITCPNASGGNWVKVGAIRAGSNAYFTDTASATGEHRKLYEVTNGWPGGVPVNPPNTTSPNPAIAIRTGELLGGVMLKAGGVRVAESSPYVKTIPYPVDATYSPNFPGQQITTTAVSYSGVMVPVIWQNGGVQPKRPLVVQVRKGGGSLTGGGTLVATATLEGKDAPNGTVVFVPFDDGAVAFAAAQHVLLVSSTAVTGFGWFWPYCDTRSDIIAAPAVPTVANIEGQGVFGQTDSFVISGVAVTRLDGSIVLVQAPTAPVLSCTVVAEQSDDKAAADANAPLLVPPYVECSWPSAATLGASCAGFKVWRRPRQTPAAPWTCIGDLNPDAFVAAGGTRAVYELQHTRFRDYTAVGQPCHGGDGAGVNGWQYALTIHNISGAMSGVNDAPVNVTTLAAPANDSALVCNAAPWANAAIRVETERSVQTDDNQLTYEISGADQWVVRVPDRIPGSVVELREEHGAWQTDERLRALRTAQLVGRTFTLLSPRGTVLHGAPRLIRVKQSSSPFDDTSIGLRTTIGPDVAPYNLPAELALDGSNDRIVVPSRASMNPGTAAFGVLFVGRFTSTANAVFLGKGNRGTADGYWLWRSAANTLQWLVDGASTSGGPTSTTVFDGAVHVVCADYDGVTARMWVDGTAVTSVAVAAGTITNAIDYAIGANNGGASNYATGWVRAFGHFGSVFTAAQIAAIYRYFIGGIGTKLPVGWSHLWDLADDRCWQGVDTDTLRDLVGTTAAGTTTGSPAERGRPWPLDARDRW